jgi:hypothetical protein
VLVGFGKKLSVSESQSFVQMSSSNSGGSDESDWKTVTSKFKEKKNNKQKDKKKFKTPSPQRVIPSISRFGRRIINAAHDEMAVCSVQDCHIEAAGANSKCAVISCNRYILNKMSFTRSSELI